jgi:hypothetical protein
MWKCSPSRPAATTTANAKSTRSSGKAAGCTSTLEPAGIPAPKPHQVDRNLNSQRPRPQPRTLAELDGLERWGVVEVAAPLGGTLPALGAVAVAALADPLHLGRGPLQRGANLIGLDLGDRPLVTLGGLPAALAQPPGEADPECKASAIRWTVGRRHRPADAVRSVSAALVSAQPKVAEVPLPCLHELSGLCFVPALEEFFGSAAGMSASVITRLTGQWQAEQEAFFQRELMTRLRALLGWWGHSGCTCAAPCSRSGV